MCIRDRINIILDPIFIFVFHLGVKGAALATVLSQAVGAISVSYTHLARVVIEADNEMQRIKDKIGMFHEI